MINDRDSAGHLHSINLRKFPGGRYNTCHFNFSGKIDRAGYTICVEHFIWKNTLSWLGWIVARYIA